MKIFINEDLRLRQINKRHADDLIRIFNEDQHKINYHWANDDEDTKSITLHPQCIDLPTGIMAILLDTIATHSKVALKYFYLGGWRFDVVVDR